jgi:hypothetical protein
MNLLARLAVVNKAPRSTTSLATLVSSVLTRTYDTRKLIDDGSIRFLGGIPCGGVRYPINPKIRS